MQLKPNPPAAEASVLPFRAPVRNPGEDGAQPAPLPEPQAEPTPPEPETADRAFHAMLARLSGGISPVALLLAYTD